MKLVVFDCDGTLVDSQHMIVEAMVTAFTTTGLDAPRRSQILNYVGLSLPEAMSAMTGLSDDASVTKLATSYRNAFAELRKFAAIGEPMFEGARETLMNLKQRDDVLLGIATGKSRRGVEAFLERERLQGIFVTIQTADDAPSKPHPAMLEQAADETGIALEDMIMIGDSSYDMEMACAAGALPIGVSWGYHRPEQLRKSGAYAVVNDFSGLFHYIVPERAVAAA